MTYKTREISLTQGRKALVDIEDFNQLNQYQWCATYRPSRNLWTITRKAWDEDRKQRINILMHREICELKHRDGKRVDHINHDSLDNRRCNLRICSRSENHGNQRKRRNSCSIYKGIWRNKNRWTASICFEQHDRYLGSFATEIEAAKAYDKAARELFGRFACVNFPKTNEQGAIQ